jgi:hypothetical protein
MVRPPVPSLNQPSGINMAELALHMAGDVKMLSLPAFCQYDKQFSSPYLAERCTPG